MNWLKPFSYNYLIFFFILNVSVSCKKEKESIIERKDDVTVLEEIEEKSKKFKSRIGEVIPSDLLDLGNSDGFWERKSYFTSTKRNEHLYQIRAKIIDNKVRYYFMGVEKVNLDNDSIDIPITAYLYELDEVKKLSLIDTLPVVLSCKRGLDEFISRQFDNFIVSGDTLHYYKELPITDRALDYCYEDNPLPKRDYFYYAIQSKEKNTSNAESGIWLNNKAKTYNSSKKLLNTDSKNLIIFNNTNNLFFLKKEVFKSLTDSTEYVNFINEDSVPYELNVNKFPPFSFDYYNNSNEPCGTLFGGMSWDKNGILYFDNSGLCYACIWKLDTNTSELIKIVPEHEAIHPFYYEIENQKFVAYVQENQLMLAKAPPSELDVMPEKTNILDPYKYYLFYDHEEPFDEIDIRDIKSDEKIDLSTGEYFLGAESRGIEFYFRVDDQGKISGSYKNIRTPYSDWKEEIIHESPEIYFLKLNINNSKVKSEVYKDSISDHYYVYDHNSLKAYKKNIDKDGNVLRESSYRLEKDEFNEGYLIIQKSKVFNASDKSFVLKDNHKGFEEKYDGHSNIKSEKFSDIGLEKFYKNDQLILIELFGSDWGVKEYKPYKYEIFKENKGKQLLEKNSNYLLKNPDNSSYYFSTDTQGLIISETFKYVR